MEMESMRRGSMQGGSGILPGSSPEPRISPRVDNLNGIGNTHAHAHMYTRVHARTHIHTLSLGLQPLNDPGFPHRPSSTQLWPLLSSVRPHLCPRGWLSLGPGHLHSPGQGKEGPARARKRTPSVSELAQLLVEFSHCGNTATLAFPWWKRPTSQSSLSLLLLKANFLLQSYSYE